MAGWSRRWRQVAGGGWLDGWKQMAGALLQPPPHPPPASSHLPPSCLLHQRPASSSLVQAGGWRPVAEAAEAWIGGWSYLAGWKARGCRQVVGARWLEWWLEVVVAGENGGVAGVAGGLVWLVWWVFGMAYRYRTEPKLRNTGNTHTAKHRICIGIDRTARLQP